MRRGPFLEAFRMTLPPAKLVQDAAFHAVLPAFVIAAAITFVGRRRAPFVAPLAVAAGWAFGNYLSEVSPWLPDGKRVEWLPILFGVAAACGLTTRWRSLFHALFAALL